jgi:hypothetical protein
MSARIPLRREAGVQVELLVAVDERGVILTRREMRPDNPLDFPTTVQMVLPLAAIGDVIRALSAACTARDRA